MGIATGVVMSDTAVWIRDHLQTVLEAEAVEVLDESGRHVGHAGAGGGGHYRVTVVSLQFDGKTMLQQHRLVYAALAEAMPDRIHALAIDTYTPAAWSTRSKTKMLP